MVDLLRTFRAFAPDGASGGGTDNGGAGAASGDGAGDGANGNAAGAAAGTATGANANNDDDLGEGGAKALDSERRARRDSDRRAKAAERELEQLRNATMTEQDKKVADAKNEGRTEAAKEFGVKLVDAELRALVAGRDVDADALLEGIDRTRFLDDKGDPDRDLLKAWVDRIAPTQGNGFPDLGQGAGRRTGGGTDMNTLIRDRMRSR